MDAEQALAELTELSTQVESAVVFDGAGKVIASTLADEVRSREVARIALELAEAAAGARPSLPDEQSLVQVEVAMRAGSAFLVRHEGRLIAATTSPEPTVGLVFYDLRTCLRTIAEAGEAEGAGRKPKPKPKPARKRAPAKRSKTTPEADAPS